MNQKIKAEKLLNKVIDDYYSGIPKNKRNLGKFGFSDKSAFIYNLFTGKYEFSYSEFKEFLKLIETL